MRALLLCASHNDLGLILSLKKLGYEVIAIGKIPGLIGEKYADRYIQLDYSDKDRVLELARELRIDVICQCCNDYGVYTAAYVAEQMGLKGYDSYETTLMLHNKDKFKQFALAHGITTPKSVGYSDIEHAYADIEDSNYPLIIKPVDASAGNGISKVDSCEEARAAIKVAFDKSRDKRIVIEPYISGTQHGFCTFLVDRKVVAYCSNNEYSIQNPYRVEIDTFPAENDAEVSERLIYEIEKIAGLLKLTDGIFHLQYIMADHVPYIIEVMRRVLGNMYSVPARLVSGFDWDYWETRAKCGLSCANIQGLGQEGFYAYKTILAKENGIITNIRIPDCYQKYLVDQCFIKSVGDVIERCESTPIGFLFFIFSSQQEMKQVLIENYIDTIVEIKANEREA